ncbi:hypothetical protein N7533_004189 [Penicillium manginii]|jgi:SAM-dependent methyltransferase|uniref:uncharacterized protein n=1 Tax=Penicillium manginii TaxID=203109 RepID=UPI0025487741|nr:uncharacterized protein N7533_004189 [Penicillium manginii]KAJ5754646.1 hypothetical protein N7533_004189 [Penicillium manginii]
MSSSTITHPAEKTFTSYGQKQGNDYAQARPDYHPIIYETILHHHRDSGGLLDTIIDIGCGPGNVARRFSPHFNHAIGLDPSEGMIAAALSLGGRTSISENIRYEVSTAEDLGRNLQQPIQDASVDLITAANAAHWFDMARFWHSAARVLKPGGSVALWAGGRSRIHPSVPGADSLQNTLDEIEEKHLRPFFEPGNLLTRSRYIDLPLPWTLEKPVPEFDESTFLRKDWDVAESFYSFQQELDMDTCEKIWETASPVTRWRQAHPAAVGTEKDVVKMFRRAIENHLNKQGVEKGKETIKGTIDGVVLVVKKKAY